MALIACPFCAEEGFDEVGLRGHLEGSYYPWGTPCEAYTAAESDASWAEFQSSRATPARGEDR